MHVFLPKAGVSVNAPMLVAIGAAAGIVSGLFGIGGGFLLTPLPMVVGISDSSSGVVIGTILARRLRADQLRILLAVIVLAVALLVSVEWVRPPDVLLSHLVGQ